MTLTDAEKIKRYDEKEKKQKEYNLHRRVGFILLQTKVAAFNKANPTKQITVSDEEVEAYIKASSK